MTHRSNISCRLFRLEMAVLSRFERENGGELLIGALCLLEVSKRGLLEVELVTILGDEENLFPGDKSKEPHAEKSKAIFIALYFSLSCSYCLVLRKHIIDEGTYM